MTSWLVDLDLGKSKKIGGADWVARVLGFPMKCGMRRGGCRPIPGCGAPWPGMTHELDHRRRERRALRPDDGADARRHPGSTPSCSCRQRAGRVFR